jgi:SAM-dependent methyltransferase
MSSGPDFGSFRFSDDVWAYALSIGHTRDSLASYCERVHSDLAGIAPFVPDKLASVWDIGCGLGGLTALLIDRWPVRRYRLTDGDGTGERKVGFKPDTKGSFNQRWSAEFVRLSTTRAARPVLSWRAGECELAVSLKSWGHHFPVDTYLREVSDSLAPRGRVILDIRTGTNGEHVLCHAGFREVGLVVEKPKRRRLVFERK